MLKNVEDVKAVLELAAQVDKALPPVKAQGAKSTWPDIRLTESEKKALGITLREGEPDFSPTEEQIDIWYKVCTEWVKPFVADEKKRQQWAVIWLKSCGCASKIIEKKLGICRTKVWYVYDSGMVRLLNYLGVPCKDNNLGKNEYRPELISSYPAGKVTGFVKINFLREWLKEIEIENEKI